MYMKKHARCGKNRMTEYSDMEPSSPIAEDPIAEEPLDGSFVEIEVYAAQQDTFECITCKKTYKSKDSLKRHMKTHDDGAIQCKTCSRFCKTKAILEEHVAEKHSKTSLCNECGMKFDRQGNLNAHMKCKHQEKSLSCPFPGCAKSFLRNQVFQDHVNSHSGMKAHSCSACEKMFHNRYRRNEHQAVCAGVKSHQCKECNDTFASRDSLAKHVNAQNKGLMYIMYMCVMCDKAYKYQSGLNKHKKTKHSS